MKYSSTTRVSHFGVESAMLMKRVLILLGIFGLATGCVAPVSEKSSVCIPVAVESPPSKLKLRTFDGKSQHVYVMEQSGGLFYGEASTASSVKPLFVKQYTAQDYIDTLNLAWKVWREYRYTNAGSAAPEQTVYELSFGETWNAFLIRIPASAGNAVPDNLVPLVNQFAVLKGAP